jgi:hypothetical protein
MRCGNQASSCDQWWGGMQVSRNILPLFPCNKPLHCEQLNDFISHSITALLRSKRRLLTVRHSSRR